MFQVNSYTDIIRIHDFEVHNTAPTGIQTDVALPGTKVWVKNQTVLLSSPPNGRYELSVWQVK